MVSDRLVVTVSASDFAASLAFYDAVLGSLGLERVQELVDEEEDEPAVEAVGWGRPGAHAVLWLVAEGTRTSGLHLRLAADSRADVETFYAAGIQAGARPVSAPRRWTLYRRGEFSAVVSDLDGNEIEAVAQE
jgi:catechol 2,3-dioxygenase-like lactoylglutathione lyase family enzyme